MVEARELPDDEVERILDVLAPITGIVDADAILAALTAAGWTLAPPGSRVVPEGGVDAETVAKAMAADIFTRSSNLPEMRDEYVELVYPTMMPLAKAALRALAEAKP